MFRALLVVAALVTPGCGDRTPPPLVVPVHRVEMPCFDTTLVICGWPFANLKDT